MPGLTRSFEDLARQAREEHWAYEDYLHEVLAAEIASRAESAIKQRLHAAAFPELKTLDQFDFGAAEGVSAPKIAEVARCSSTCSQLGTDDAASSSPPTSPSPSGLASSAAMRSSLPRCSIALPSTPP